MRTTGFLKNQGVEKIIGSVRTELTKLLNDTEDEAEALKRIPIDQLDDPEIDGNILGYMEDTKEVIVKDVHGNANRNIAVCGGPGTGKSRTLVRNIIFQCVRRGESIFITDPKGEMAESMIPSTVCRD